MAEIPAATTTCCRACHGADLEVVLDLGMQPHAGSFPTTDELRSTPTWPLVLEQCRACGLFQLAGASPPETDVEGSPAPTSSATMAAHVERLVDEIVDGGLARPGDLVIDLASHGGHPAAFLESRGLRPVVVESVGWRIADLRAAGHDVVELSPEARGADLTRLTDAALVVDFYRLAHLPDLDAGVAAMAAMLRPGGHAVIEFDHALTTIAETQFDAIRHGHFSYLTLSALEPLLHRHGLAVTAARPQSVYGGALRLVLERADAAGGDASVSAARAGEVEAGLTDPRMVASFRRRVADRCTALRDHLSEALARGDSVAGYGAPTRASTLLNAAGVTPRELPYTVDRSRAKRGRHLPGSGIPIASPERLRSSPPAEVLILTWDIAEEVVSQLADLPPDTRFVVPLPELRVFSSPARETTS